MDVCQVGWWPKYLTGNIVNKLVPRPRPVAKIKLDLG